MCGQVLVHQEEEGTSSVLRCLQDAHHPHPVHCQCFSEQQGLICTGAFNEIKLWDYLSLDLLSKVSLESSLQVSQLVLLDPYAYLLVATEENTIYCLSILEGPTRLALFNKHYLADIQD